MSGKVTERRRPRAILTSIGSVNDKFRIYKMLSRERSRAKTRDKQNLSVRIFGTRNNDNEKETGSLERIKITTPETALAQNNNKKEIYETHTCVRSSGHCVFLNNAPKRNTDMIDMRHKYSSLFPSGLFAIGDCSAKRSNRWVWSFSSFPFSRATEIEIIIDSRFSLSQIRADYAGGLMAGNVGRWRGVSTNYPLLTFRVPNSTVTSNPTWPSPFVARNKSCNCNKPEPHAPSVVSLINFTP